MYFVECFHVDEGKVQTGFEAITNSEFAEVLPHSVLAGSGHVLSKQKHVEFWKGVGRPLYTFWFRYHQKYIQKPDNIPEIRTFSDYLSWHCFRHKLFWSVFTLDRLWWNQCLGVLEKPLGSELWAHGCVTARASFVPSWRCRVWIVAMFFL